MPEKRLWERQVPPAMRAQGGAPATELRTDTGSSVRGGGVPREQELSLAFPSDDQALSSISSVL